MPPTNRVETFSAVYGHEPEGEINAHTDFSVARADGI